MQSRAGSRGDGMFAAVKQYLPLYTIALFLLFGGVTDALSQTLKIATLTPDGSNWMKKFEQGAQEISDKTAGRVQFRFYTGGVMGEDKTVLRKMKVGQLDGAIFSNGTLNNIFPGSEVYNLVLKFNSYEEIDFVRPKIDPIIIDGINHTGLTVLGLSELGFAYLMSTEPVATLQDLQKQKAWVPENNETAAEALSAFSISPIPLPIKDVLLALQTGMINAVAGSPVGALMLQWHRKIRYVTDLPIAYVYGGLTVNTGALAAMSPTDRAVVKEVMAKVTRDLDGVTRQDNIAAIDAMKKQGIVWIKPDEGTITKLRTLIKDANDNVINHGNLDRELVAKLDALLTEFRQTRLTQVPGSAPDTGHVR